MSRITEGKSGDEVGSSESVAQAAEGAGVPTDAMDDKETNASDKKEKTKSRRRKHVNSPHRGRPCAAEQQSAAGDADDLHRDPPELPEAASSACTSGANESASERRRHQKSGHDVLRQSAQIRRQISARSTQPPGGEALQRNSGSAADFL